MSYKQQVEHLPGLFAAGLQHPSPPEHAVGLHSASAPRPPVCVSETLPAAPPAGHI